MKKQLSKIVVGRVGVFLPGDPTMVVATLAGAASLIPKLKQILLPK